MGGLAVLKSQHPKISLTPGKKMLSENLLTDKSGKQQHLLNPSENQSPWKVCPPSLIHNSKF
jgi:hypothetical protein